MVNCSCEGNLVIDIKILEDNFVRDLFGYVELGFV